MPLFSVAYDLDADLTDKEERELLSEKYRSESEEFEPKRGCEYFKKVFEELLEEIR